METLKAYVAAFTHDASLKHQLPLKLDFFQISFCLNDFIRKKKPFVYFTLVQIFLPKMHHKCELYD